jgi:hypothetical protein
MYIIDPKTPEKLARSQFCLLASASHRRNSKPGFKPEILFAVRKLAPDRPSMKLTDRAVDWWLDERLGLLATVKNPVWAWPKVADLDFGCCT